MRGHLSSHVSGVPRPIFEVERPIERSFSQLQDSACRNTVKCRVRTSNANHCMGDVVHTLGCQKRVGSSEPLSQDSHDRFSKLNGRLKGLSLDQLNVSAGQNTVNCKSLPEWRHKTYILWGAKTRWVLTMSGCLPSHISGFPRPIFKVERPIERFFSQLHVSAGHNPDKWRMRPSNANHCPSDVLHTLEMGLGHVRTVS